MDRPRTSVETHDHKVRPLFAACNACDPPAEARVRVGPGCSLIARTPPPGKLPGLEHPRDMDPLASPIVLDPTPSFPERSDPTPVAGRYAIRQRLGRGGHGPQQLALRSEGTGAEGAVRGGEHRAE